MRWTDEGVSTGTPKPRVSVWTVLFGSALGAAIAAALGYFIEMAQAIIR